MLVGELRELRKHQTASIDGIRDAMARGARSPMLSLSTGGGKTVIAAAIVHGAQRKGKRVAFSVPSLGLIDQTFRRFAENGIDPSSMGVIQGDHPWRRPWAPIQICSAQTLDRRGVPETDLAILDEAHIRFRVYEDWMLEALETSRGGGKAPLFIGLSATPWTVGLGKLFDAMVKPTSLKELIAEGYLSDFRVFAPSRPDLRGVTIRGGDYAEKELSERMNTAQLTADIVTTWLDKGRGRPTLCFATGRMHAKTLHDRFADAGVKVAYVDKDTPREERDEIGCKLAKGEIEIVTNIGCLTTGIDWDVRCIILARPTKSEMLFVQIIGRGLRTAEGKDYCLILDHSNTHHDLGFVTDIEGRRTELDMGKPPDKAKAEAKDRGPMLPKPCDECGCLIPILEVTCPECGYQKPLPRIMESEGLLEEMDRFKKASLPPLAARRSSVSVLRELGQQTCYQQIKYIQESRGRTDGWAAYRYKDLWDAWPPWSFKSLSSEPPCPEMFSWMKSRDIAYIKAKRAAEAKGDAMV